MTEGRLSKRKKMYGKGEKDRKKRDEKEAGLFWSALCLLLLTCLVSVAVAAMFGVRAVLFQVRFPFQREEKLVQKQFSQEFDNTLERQKERKTFETCFQKMELKCFQFNFFQSLDMSLRPSQSEHRNLGCQKSDKTVSGKVDLTNKMATSRCNSTTVPRGHAHEPRRCLAGSSQRHQLSNDSIWVFTEKLWAQWVGFNREARIEQCQFKFTGDWLISEAVWGSSKETHLCRARAGTERS